MASQCPATATRRRDGGAAPRASVTNNIPRRRGQPPCRCPPVEDGAAGLAGEAPLAIEQLFCGRRHSRKCAARRSSRRFRSEDRVVERDRGQIAGAHGLELVARVAAQPKQVERHRPVEEPGSMCGRPNCWQSARHGSLAARRRPSTANRMARLPCVAKAVVAHLGGRLTGRNALWQGARSDAVPAFAG